MGRRASSGRQPVTKKAKRYRDAKDKRPEGGFLALPYIALRSAQWGMLSPLATKLLMDLLAQYNTNNNGDLSAAWTIMRGRGWKSKDSLYKALHELEARGWIQRTRQGGRHVATLLGITVFALDHDNPKVKAKLDILPSDFRRGAWTQASIAPPVVPMFDVSCAPPIVPIRAKLARGSYQSDTPNQPIAPPVVPVEAVLAESLPRRPYTSIDIPSPTPVLLPPSPRNGAGVGSALPHSLPDSGSKTSSGPEFDKARQRSATQRARRERAKAKAEPARLTSAKR